MAPLPQSNTTRWYLDYTTGSVNHTCMMRSTDACTAGQASDAFDALFTALASGMSLTTVIGMRFSEHGSNLSFPADWSGGATYGSGAADHQNEASYIDFVGRSLLGHRVRVTVFGQGYVNDRTLFRITSAASAGVAAALAALVADPDTFSAIDGNVPIWNSYGNIGLNSYWQKQFR